MKTVLCVPGHDRKKVVRCREYGADLILFDLEDAVPMNAKEAARAIVAETVTSADAVRVNAGALQSADALAIRDAAGCIWLPKATDWWEWRDFSEAFKVRIASLVETPSALLSAQSDVRVLRSLKRLAFIVFGADDYAASTMTGRNSAQVEHARLQVAQLAAALGVPAIDSPCIALEEAVVRGEVQRAWELGYRWKGAIHPLQVEWIHDEGARLRELDESGARAILSAYEAQSEAVVMSGVTLLAPPLVRRSKEVMR